VCVLLRFWVEESGAGEEGGWGRGGGGGRGAVAPKRNV